MDPIKVKDLINQSFLKLRLIAGESGLDNVIYTTEFYIPGLFLKGEGKISENVIILLTPYECDYIRRRKSPDRIFHRLKNTPFLLLAGNCDPGDKFIKKFDRAGIPLLATPYTATEVIILLGNYLKFMLARRQKLHGTLVDVFGVGIFLRGESGVGKSECALDLVRKGHKLIGDDFIELIAYPEGKLTGKSGAPTPETRFLMELRGIGLIDILHTYGVASVEDTKTVDIVVELKRTQEETFDRLGFDFKKTVILGVELPYVDMPVVPGKNISTVVESLALKYLSHKMGFETEKLIEEFFIEKMNDD